MYVKEIHVNSFRHLEHVHLGPFGQPPEHSDLVVLAGPNGGGKSSVLELLGYALSNSWSLGWSLRRSFPSNSFEVAIAVTPYERDLVREYIESSHARYADDVLEYFQQNGTYYRAYNYTDGKYQENTTLYNQIHNLVTNALRNHYSRSLGLFLRSDRHYPPDGFKRDRLFQYDEMIKRDHVWNLAFNTSDVQYRDMFEFLVQQRYHYFHRLGAYHHRTSTGGGETEEPPTDPLLVYGDLLRTLFPDYRFADNAETVPTNLFIQLPSGEVIPFSDLSSGEKEVFFILSFFLRHDVTNAIIVIDEPELHLHPQLARLLIRTMQNIRPGNQVWLATHNAEIIDEAGRDRVFYLSRDRETQKSVVTHGTDETEAMRNLKDLFGYSGYIGIARSIVFLEGVDSSSDRKMFASLFPEYGREIKFVPCRSVENLAKMNMAVLSILESNLGWVQFYLLRDRDFLTVDIVEKYSMHFSGRMYVLNRYHIENYLLDEALIAKVQTEILDRPTDQDHVHQKLITVVRRISGEVLRDMVAFRLNLAYRPEDFSVGDYMKGQPIVDAVGEWIPEKIEGLRNHIAAKAETVNSDLCARTNPAALEALVAECQEEMRAAVSNGSDGWRSVFPGRRILEEYARMENLGKPPVLQNSLIKELSTATERIAPELQQVMRVIVDGKIFVP